MPLRCVIDNMIFDEIAAERGLVAKLRDLTTNGSLELLVTSKQAEECQLAQRPDLLGRVERRSGARHRRRALPTGRVAARCRPGGPAEPYDTLRAFAGSPRHTNDHLGVATAHLETLPFVTEDKRLHGFASTQPGIDIWRWRDLRRRIDAL